ncbi:MAG: hypothetical protein OJF60_003186 [Burkholderiaceae bacterium]|jgi:uncharacterized membrane protein|nr:MAG: hypothetical protein OJF60_003186 [Burkholderiaceae bacterium]
MHHTREHGIPRARMEALTDGVYAVAITLLVLDLRLPELPAHAASQDVAQALLALVPKISVWLLSFWVVALFWMSGARLTRLAAEGAMPSPRIELSQLALVGLMPFSTSMMAQYGDLAVAAAVYSAHLLALSLLSLARIVAAFPSAAAVPQPAEYAALRRTLLRRAGLPVACLVLAVPLAFVVPGWNMLAMVPLALVPPASRLWDALRRRRRN